MAYTVSNDMKMCGVFKNNDRRIFVADLLEVRHTGPDIVFVTLWYLKNPIHLENAQKNEISRV